MTDDVTTLTEQVRLVADREVSSRELVDAALDRIRRLDPQLNAFATVLDEEARAEAADRDAATERGPLHGVPIAVKEENDVAGLPTRYGGAAFTRPVAADGEVVRRLRAAGAVVIGTTRMPEFGIWPWTESVANGYTRNPWNPLRSPAGSSGGSAAAVASGMVATALAGDGGGSIRLPASWCGLYGLKPQRGRTSAGPHTHLWRALGTIGALTRTVADAALMYDVIAGTVPSDRWRATSWPTSLTDALAVEPRPLRIGFVTRLKGAPDPDPETVAALEATAQALRGLGHAVVEVAPRLPVVTVAFMAQTAAGVAAEFARADHPELVERRTRFLMRLTSPLRLAAGWGERESVAQGAAFAEAFFSSYDLLLTPTTPTPAVRVGQLDSAGPVRVMLKATRTSSYTSVWNVLGNPAAAIPSGLSADGLPLSVQLVGPPDGEPLLVQVSAQLERVRPWAHRRPVVR